MEEIFLSILISLLLFFIAYKIYLFNSTNQKNLPPSPPSLPIIGHFHILSEPIHRCLHGLSKKYGPIFSLKLGTQLAVIVTSSSAADECFTKNDVVLANRPKTLMGKHVGYNHTDLISAPYGDHWRNLRKLCNDHIFSVARLNAFLSARKDEVERLITCLSRNTREEFAKVEMKSLFRDLAFNNITRMVAGKRYYGDDVASKEEAREFNQLIDELFKYGTASNPADFVPLLDLVTFGSFTKKMKGLGTAVHKFMQCLIDEHRNKKDGDTESRNTMVDHLLSLQMSEPEYYTDEIIKGLVMVIIVAGTDTTSATLEWALSNLVNHPDILEKAKCELDSQIGQNRLIEESDLPKLPYLLNILSEVLRLYPVAPLLLPRYSSGDCTIGGFYVPRGSIVLVNVWGIHRDPTLWDDPDSFRPERFDKAQVEAHKLMTFGMGRRSCPGIGSAQRIMGLSLGSLIQCFEWKRTSGAEVDMTEGEGISMPRANPLEVMCKGRPIVFKLFPENKLEVLENKMLD